MGRQPNQPLKTYPGYYDDPDERDAYHLTLAAWHLIESGHAALASQLVSGVEALFEDVPLDKKSGIPRKRLGETYYYSTGILQVKHPGTGCDADVPASPWIPGDRDEETEQRIQSKDVKAMLRRTRLSWLPAMQVAETVTEKPMSPAFRPQAVLKRIMECCSAWEGVLADELKPQAGPMLAAKLAAIAGKCPIDRSHGYSSQIQRNLSYDGRPENSWHNYTRDYGLAWLTPDQASRAAGQILKDEHGIWESLNSIEPNVVRWESADASCRSTLMGNVVETDKARAAGLPFGLRYVQKRYSAEDGRAMNWSEFWKCEEQKLSDIIDGAIAVAVLVSDLQRMHAALSGCGEKLLLPVLEKAKIIDPALCVPKNLYLRAARCRMAEAWSPEFGREPAREAMDALEQLLKSNTAVRALEDGMPVYSPGQEAKEVVQ